VAQRDEGMQKRFESKVVLITGATSGIGQATAERFAAEGAKVVCVGRNSDRGNALVKRIKANSGSALFVAADVRQRALAESSVKKATDEFGRLDVLFNNAGIELIRGAAEMTEEEWDEVVDTNLKSMFLFSKYALPWLKKTKGVIINTGSELGFVGAPNYTAYCASKGGAVLFTRALALECAPLGIRVNCVCPGATQTSMLEREVAHYKDKEAVTKSILENVPLHRIAAPEEIASAVFFLASEEAKYVTGASLSIDGGTTAK
jgi:NAD(P)-dependent dehydrogenase (short-subunit alcohol dehydrogenase family)